MQFVIYSESMICDWKGESTFYEENQQIDISIYSGFGADIRDDA